MGIHHFTQYLCSQCNDYDSEGNSCSDCGEWLCRDCQYPDDNSISEPENSLSDGEQEDPVICLDCDRIRSKRCKVCGENGNADSKCGKCHGLVCQKCSYDFICWHCGINTDKVRDYLLDATGCKYIGEIIKKSVLEIKKT